MGERLTVTIPYYCPHWSDAEPVLAYLLHHCMWFEWEPMPEDIVHITVKAENAARVRAALLPDPS